jgi:hypothetical protein
MFLRCFSLDAVCKSSCSSPFCCLIPCAFKDCTQLRTEFFIFHISIRTNESLPYFLGACLKELRNSDSVTQQVGCNGDGSDLYLRGTWFESPRGHQQGFRCFPQFPLFAVYCDVQFSLYLTGNTLRLRYKAQPVDAVWGNSRCLL